VAVYGSKWLTPNMVAEILGGATNASSRCLLWPIRDHVHDDGPFDERGMSVRYTANWSCCRRLVVLSVGRCCLRALGVDAAGAGRAEPDDERDEEQNDRQCGDEAA
jgi:hypothetical protein